MKVSSPLNSLRFIADECCPGSIVQALRDAGHDVRYAAETNQQAPDETIAELALADDRLVITQDFDFGEMAIRHRIPFHGVVLLAFGQARIAERIARTLSVVGELGGGLAGHLTVIDRRRHRQRLLAD